MAKISLCMIVRDEEEVLARCLDSAEGLADEIVIADTGSKDGTRKIAARYTAKLFSFPWRDDFSAARNFAFSQAEGDYLFWLDADDVIPEESRTRFSALRELLDGEAPDMVSCPYAMGEGGTTFYRERFLKREKGFRFRGRVHECVPPQGKAVRFPLLILHAGSKKDRKDRNLHIYLKWAAEERLGGRDLFYYGRELFYHGLYTEARAVLEEMLAGEGWYVNKIEACKVLSGCLAARGDAEGAKAALLRSFLFGEPRASLCCALGDLFSAERNHLQAVFWYETALRCKDHTAEGDFEEPVCHGFHPYLGLVCGYYALGDFDRARFYHQKTEELSPDHPSVVFNRKFFPSAKDSASP